MEHIQRLNTVSFSNMQNWSILSHLTVANYQSKHKHIKIGSFLKRIKEAVVIQDDVYYKRATIKINNGGVFLRDTVLGKNIGTKNQFIIKKGQLLLSKIDARNGAFGIVPEELDNGVITGNFWTYEIDTTKILPQILSNILSSKRFQEIWEACSNGTTNRHYLQEADFLNTSIPVPSLPEQLEMAQNYNMLIEKSKAIIFDYITDINNQLIETYNLKTDFNLNSNLLKFVDFKEMSRWDVENISSKIHLSANVPLRKISEFIKSWMEDENGSLGLNSMDYPDELFSYLGMENVDKNTGKLVALPRVRGKEIKSTTLRVPKDYIIYNKLRPYLNKYWINADAIEKVICSSEFFVFDINGINREYFIYILSSSFVQKQLELQYSGARMPRINKDIFFNVKIPVPNDEEQERVVKVLNEIKQNYEQKKMDSKELEAKAKQDFENAIFGD